MTKSVLFKEDFQMFSYEQLTLFKGHILSPAVSSAVKRKGHWRVKGGTAQQSYTASKTQNLAASVV